MGFVRFCVPYVGEIVLCSILGYVRNVRAYCLYAAVLISVARICHKQGIFLRVAVGDLIRDRGWSIFKPPDLAQKEIAVKVAAV